MNERTKYSEEVGKIKRTSGQNVFAPAREELLLQGLERRNKGPLTSAELRSIYSEIISVSRHRQKTLRLAYLGPEGSYCHQAALKRFGSFDQYLPSRNIQDIFDLVSVQRGLMQGLCR